ncbi:MAG: hypothetical protein ACE1Y4_04675, partial [Lysobacterales bacterium]
TEAQVRMAVHQAGNDQPVGAVDGRLVLVLCRHVCYGTNPPDQAISPYQRRILEQASIVLGSIRRASSQLGNVVEYRH